MKEIRPSSLICYDFLTDFWLEQELLLLSNSHYKGSSIYAAEFDMSKLMDFIHKIAEHERMLQT